MAKKKKTVNEIGRMSEEEYLRMLYGKSASDTNRRSDLRRLTNDEYKALTKAPKDIAE